MNPLSDKVGNYTESQNLLFDFVSRGIVILDPQNLGIEEGIHAEIYEKEKTLFDEKTPISCATFQRYSLLYDHRGL